MSPSVSVVIPAGDVGTLPLLVGALPPVDEVIVVVGRDAGTGHALPRAARVIRQTRSGVGNALACGVAASTGDIVVTLPGDGSCDPAEVPLLLEALRSGADVVHGSRYLAGAGRDHHGDLASRCADLILLWFVRVLFGCRPTDPGFGFRAFWRDTAGRLGLPRVAGTAPVHGDGREIEPLLTVRTALGGLRGAEVPATAYPRTGEPSTAPLLPAVRALVTEYAERRRSAEAGNGVPENIVVLTGPTPASGRAPGKATAAKTIAPLVNEPHTAAVRYPSNGRDRRWPVPNDRRRATGQNHPNSGSIPGDPGFVERRRGERRVLDRRTSARDLPYAGHGLGAPRLNNPRRPADGRLNTGRLNTGRPNDGRQPDEVIGRRRWRDSRGEAVNVAREAGAGRRRLQGRPNLRVINGEGTGTTGNRGGHLRSV